jgi:hypothetical protein
LEPRVSRSEAELLGWASRGWFLVPLGNWIAVNVVKEFQPEQKMKTRNMTTAHLKKPSGRAPLQRAFLLIQLALALAWFALSPAAQAQLPSPTPDGGYPGSNTAEGTNALFNLTTGADNTATGAFALTSNTTGNANTATGSAALESNTSGTENTAIGVQALFSNTTGSFNTANGDLALAFNTTGSFNTATGLAALEFNGTGNHNVAYGFEALKNNSTGVFNTATGDFALFNNTTGNDNTANGVSALGNNTTGSFNIALGVNAGFNLTTGSHNIDIGNAGAAGESNTIRIGREGTQLATFIAGIHGATVASGIGVIVGTNGQLGTKTSSERFKEAIKSMDKASEAILQLKPVTFRYKRELDPEGIPQFGLIAEQVEKVNPDLVVRDAGGKVYTVRYEAVNAMLLNEFLKEHRKVEEQGATIAELKFDADNQRAISTKQEATIAQQQKQIEALTATVQKVSDRLELSIPAPQMVADNQ